MVIIVFPCELSETNISIISALISVSRLPVGSSARIMLGLFTMARAMATLCCCPPESWEGRCLSRPPSPTISSAASALSRLFFCGVSSYTIGSSTFSSADVRPRRLKL